MDSPRAGQRGSYCRSRTSHARSLPALATGYRHVLQHGFQCLKHPSTVATLRAHARPRCGTGEPFPEPLGHTGLARHLLTRLGEGPPRAQRLVHR